ncbi:MAG: hypothetical protein JWR52_3383 [Marmoricola sp.]|nr:hypothetical protein [Marmoricola sp.]
MRVLVATDRSNGVEPGDYTHCVEGELVYMQEPCASDLKNPDGPCGCGRGFAGMSSHRATTTALVTDSDLGREEIREALRSSLEAGGWLDPTICTADLAEAMVEESLHDVFRVAEHFPAGSVVRRRLSQYFVGSTPR